MSSHNHRHHMHSVARRLIAFALGAATSLPGLAQVSQTPLLTKGTAVAPNIVFMLDDSGSMGDSNRGVFLFQDNSKAAWGVSGGGVFTPTTTDGVNPYADSGNTRSLKIAQCSPDINQLYYNPAILYSPPYDNTGTRLAPATTINFVALGSNINATDINVPVCKDGSSNPILYRYINSYGGANPGTASGKGPPYWDGVHQLHLATSYTTTTITSGGTYTKSAARTDCASTTCNGTEELQNFKNWSKWYRQRNSMARSAVVEAFAGQGPNFRLGWGTINSLGTGTKLLKAGVQTYDATVRKNFIDFLNSNVSTTSSLGTPNKTALDTVGKYHQRTDGDGPWGTTPKVTSVGTATVASPTSTEATSAFAQCRRSNAILLTDGYYNSDTVTTAGNPDGVKSATVTLPGGGTTVPYDPTVGPDFGKPYKDSANSNTFADVAMKYWVNDLVPAPMANKVSKIPGVDEAVWQHLNFWAIGLGLDGSIDQSLYTTPASLNTITWPTPVDNTPKALDDMWHATINGRGGFLNAGDPQKLTQSLNTMIGQILKSSSSQAGVAVSTVSLSSGTKKFVPAYTTGEWTGNIIANNLNPATGNETSIAWQAETRDPVTGAETNNTLYPDLSVAFGSRNMDNRNIAVGTTTGAVSFTYPAMTTAGIASQITPAFTGQIVDATLVNYLRGNRSQEGSGTSRNYRVRSALMGDIVNSTPALIRPSIDYGYGDLPAGTPGLSTYATHLATKTARTEGGLFVGANDGMLHVLAENDGREVFAFVPRAVLPKIAKLADPTYTHRYFVDGPLSQGDFFNGTSWKNVVVGTTGAGAVDATSPYAGLKSVFAIDATTPTAVANTSVLWERASDQTGFTELGNVLSDVQIGLMRNGEWAAIFGNGYKSAAGKAQLFIVNLANGTLIRKIDTVAGPNNGLGGVRLVRNTNNVVIGAYAGDLLGNMWRFDLNDTVPTNWSTGYGTATAPVPLYKATGPSTAPGFTPAGANTAQPISAAPFVMAHPSGGYLVAFGTGKFFEDADLTSTGTQTAYGIRDPLAFGTAPSPNPTTSKISTVNRTLSTATQNLVLQTIAADITVSRTITAFDNSTSTQDVTYYTVSSNAIDWTTKDGWYFNQPFSGQRTVFPVDSLLSSVVRVDTIQPGAVSSDPCSSTNSGKGFNYIIDALTGGSLQGPVLDTNGDGVINSSDYSGASGYSTSADGRDISMQCPTCGGGGGDVCVAPKVKFVILGANGESTYTCVDPCLSASPPASCNSSSPINVKRSWRQLFMR